MKKIINFLMHLGESVSEQTVDRLRRNVRQNCKIWDLYGPAEAAIVSTFHQINFTSNNIIVSIGRPLPNYKCMILDETSPIDHVNI